ncbi:MAG: helix-turn-helix transcriptional regulator [Chitinophagaceae bacterium]|nr:helix-turn-helix transcriptional regulator [Chitinophagaceae bacterium]
MGYKLLGTDFEDFLSPSEEENKTLFRTPKGDISFEQQHLREGLFILQSKYQMTDDVSVFGKGEDALLEIQLNLSGTDIHFTNQSRHHVTKASSGNITFLSAEDNHADINFQKNVIYQTFDVHIPLTLLNKYAGESDLMDTFINKIHLGKSSVLTNGGVTLHNTNVIKTIHDIRNCTFEGLTRRIYLESKVYELIALLYEGVSNRPRISMLNKYDRDKIQHAAYLIKENLEKPLTILELAKQVGVNQTKLKEGFKEVFGYTIFGYLQHIRMNEARMYLLNTDLSIQQISHLLGYQNMSNFSAAFKKFNGISPLKIRGL